MTRFADGNPALAGHRVIKARCPACGHLSVLERLTDQSQDVEFATNVKRLTVGIRRCPNRDCLAVIHFEDFLTGGGHSLTTYPPQLIDFDATNLPTPILASLREAISCHSVEAYKACALMVRRVLEELCEDRGAKGANLMARLKGLGTSAVIPPELLDAADELRLLGNDAAHIEAKAYDAIGEKEATLAIELAKELLKAVYQYADLVGRMRALKKTPREEAVVEKSQD